MSLKDAIEKAVSECVDEGMLMEFFETHKSEVANMLTTEWNFADELAVARLEEREFAREEERKNIARFLLADGKDVDYVVRATGLDLNTVLHLQGE